MGARKEHVDSKELRDLKSENTSLKKQVSRLRKRLARFGPEEPEEDEPDVELTPPKDELACPDCGASLTTIKTPSGKEAIYCQKQCGFKKVSGKL